MFQEFFGKNSDAPEEEGVVKNEAEESGIEVNDSPVEEVVLEDQPEKSGSTVTIIEGADGEAGSERVVETTPVGEVDGEELTIKDESVNDGDPYNTADKAA